MSWLGESSPADEVRQESTFHEALLLRNIELKARLHDLENAREIARSLATKELGLQEQTDTYFRCSNGRLKLRQIEHAPAQLIWYARPDEDGPKASDYRLVPVTDPETLKAALSDAYGIWCVVRKRREIYLFHNVRIHLDAVEGLGIFLEFEAVLGPAVGDPQGHAQLADLRDQFFDSRRRLAGGFLQRSVGRTLSAHRSPQLGVDAQHVFQQKVATQIQLGDCRSPARLIE